MEKMIRAIAAIVMLTITSERMKFPPGMSYEYGHKKPLPIDEAASVAVAYADALVNALYEKEELSNE